MSETLATLSTYRGSPDSTIFGFQDNRVIRGIVLIGDWFSTETREIDAFDFQSPFLHINKKFFLLKTLLFFSESNI